jgi:transcriptional regulator with XRE-family HTH domain
MRALRTSLKLSQVEMAKKIGVNTRTYQRLENGDTERLEARTLEALIKMGVDIRDLVASDTSNWPPKVAEPDFDGEDDGHGLTPEKIRQTAAATGGDPASAVPAYLSELTLAVRFFGAWANSMAIQKPEDAKRIEAGLRRLQSEIENGRMVALKQEAIAQPEAWGEFIRSLVTVLPEGVVEDLMDWLAQRTAAGGAVRKPGPGHKRKVDGAGG